MKILGLTFGELSTAAIMMDGEIVAAASEERFSRRKNDERYPEHAIAYCLRAAGVRGDELDRVCIAGLELSFDDWATRVYSTFTMADQLRAQHEYWQPKLYGGVAPAWTQVFRDKLDVGQKPGTFAELARRSEAGENVWPQLKADINATIRAQLNAPNAVISHADHHACHAAYAYWGSPFRDGRTLVLTADAFGDGLSATVSVAEGSAIQRVHAVPHTEFRLARLYRYITLLLGMKPNEHEYKVMGLAPYARDSMAEGPYEVFRKTMFVDGLGFGWHEYPPDMYFYFKERLEGFRFDAIAGGLQRYTEEILAAWVTNAIRHTGASRVVFSGGVSMNVKALKTIHELPGVSDLFVCGSGSDESLALGACYHAMAESLADPYCIRPHGPYLGAENGSAEVMAWATRSCLADRYDLVANPTPEHVAQSLAAGLVVARCVGRMEFGQRALGNRSILADPRSRDMVEKINHQIKNRDFWMPFAPSVLAERAARYVVNPKAIQSPWMTIAFDSTPLARDELRAAIHPADFTLRPQFVSADLNPDFHALLLAFERITGVGALLNTSFNLHGEPIVCTLDDALHVFEHSALDVLVVDGLLIRKRQRTAG